ncbi:hypothetical protein QVD17_20435 [Tagetes erecta]|uniref:Uncharacterized protein n=1 Tax=Tagetes erecta TaxID=13708 RepID=A0AAD8KPN2_TARER|nr:hypothetical protein QVD17_20435 [Tagetes erecta]
MNINNLPQPVAKRTRLQTQLFYQEYCGSARNQSCKRNRGTGFTHEVIDLDDDDGINNRAFETTSQQESDDNIKGYGSASPFKTGPHTYINMTDDLDEEDNSDSDDRCESSEELECDEDLQTSCKLDHGTEDSTKTDSSQSTEDDDDEQPCLTAEQLSGLEFVNLLNSSDTDDECMMPEEQDADVDLQKDADDSEDEVTSESESESDDLDDSDFSLENKRPHQPVQNCKEKVLCRSTARIEKNHSMHKTNMIKSDTNPMDELSDTNVNEKQNAKDKVNRVKYRRSKKGIRRNDGSCVDAILDSILSNVAVNDKKEDYSIPLKFRFDDSEDESSNITTDEWGAEELFQEMEFAQTCEEIGSYATSKGDEISETWDYYDDIDPCERGVHDDIVFEEQTGLRCCLCGAVLLESRYVIPKLANYTPDKSKRSYRFDEQFSSHENPYFVDSDADPYDIFKQTKGTVWELIPTHIQVRMYPHQQQGFEFLWKNLAGTVELSRLQTLDPRGCGHGGDTGGCIISHAPGTGKTFLTIVFIESFLKKFPKCCPVIVAPASMLLTWEAEFKKWQVGFSFINLQNTESLRKEMTVSGSRRNKDYLRAMKVRSWINDGGVLGVSYNLYEKLARDSNKRKKSHERIRACLLDKPGLVVLDEGHTPRNQNSNIWNTLRKLETKNRVVLSGTPFQNNFKELFNTLCIVRPTKAKSIAREKFFADMIQSKNMKKCGDRSSSENIEKLKEIISPFVHVHKGHILESKLPGLKRSVILLNPPAFQKGLIENMGISASNFEYEHKVALVSVHPSLILHCALSEKEKNLINKQELEDVRLDPEVGVKTRFVMELIRLSLSLNEKVLIFSQYIQPSGLLQDQIARAFGWEVEREVTHIKGKIQQTRRQKIINAFNDPKSELKVLLASTKCCSEGIHLYGASRVVLLDVVWNPSVEKQAISRAYRLGQKKVVYTYHLMAAGTTEEEKYDRQVEKGRLAELVFASACMTGGELIKKKVIVDDDILQQMVDHKELKDMFKKIRYPEYISN